MLQTISQPVLRPVASREPNFNIFIACDGHSAFAHAHKVEQQVKELCDEEIETTRAFWSFSLLRHEPLHTHAVAEAAAADMVIISLAHGYEIPAQVKSLLEQLPRHPIAGQTALVLLLNVEENKSRACARAATAYLRQLAETHGLEFFCNRNQTVEADVTPAPPIRPHLRGMTAERIIFYHIPWTAGGINE